MTMTVKIYLPSQMLHGRMTVLVLQAMQFNAKGSFSYIGLRNAAALPQRKQKPSACSWLLRLQLLRAKTYIDYFW